MVKTWHSLKMPPRIQSQRVTGSVLPYLSSSTSPSVSSSTSTTTTLTQFPTSCTSSPSLSHPSRRTFTSTPAPQTRLRSQMFEWLSSEGRRLKTHEPRKYKYVTNLKELGSDSPDSSQMSHKPFPLNPNFVSESVLSEGLRGEIFRRVVVLKRSVRAVSIELNVDMRRVAAVVRLVQLERQWRSQGKPLALPYARAVHEMLPTTSYSTNFPRRHESINDLPVHRLTDPQIFYPVSESRQFTRVDAGRVFSGAPRLRTSHANAIAKNPADAVASTTQHPASIETVGKGDDEHQVLQPADARIPHPYLVAHERDLLAQPFEARENWNRLSERLQKEETAAKTRKEAAVRRQEESTDKVAPEDSRFEFRISDVVVSKETTGADGRGAKAPGRRYGVPSYERKKGEVKIPTSVRV